MYYISLLKFWIQILKLNLILKITLKQNIHKIFLNVFYRVFLFLFFTFYRLVYLN